MWALVRLGSSVGVLMITQVFGRSKALPAPFKLALKWLQLIGGVLGDHVPFHVPFGSSVAALLALYTCVCFVKMG